MLVSLRRPGSRHIYGGLCYTTFRSDHGGHDLWIRGITVCHPEPATPGTIRCALLQPEEPGCPYQVAGRGVCKWPEVGICSTEIQFKNFPFLQLILFSCYNFKSIQLLFFVFYILSFNSLILMTFYFSSLQEELLLGDSKRELNQYVLLQEHPTDLLRLSAGRKCPDQGNAFHNALVECIRLHRFILHCSQELENLFSPYCLVKSLQITFQLCLLVFVGVSGTREVLRIVNQLQYLGLTIFELLMFTYCGELLSRHSIRSGDAFWRGAWWKHAHFIRQDILIFLVNSRRAVHVTAGKFYVMDVNRLRSVRKYSQ